MLCRRSGLQHFMYAQPACAACLVQRYYTYVSASHIDTLVCGMVLFNLVNQVWKKIRTSQRGG